MVALAGGIETGEDAQAGVGLFLVRQALSQVRNEPIAPTGDQGAGAMASHSPMLIVEKRDYLRRGALVADQRERLQSVDADYPVGVAQQFPEARMRLACPLEKLPEADCGFRADEAPSGTVIETDFDSGDEVCERVLFGDADAPLPDERASVLKGAGYRGLDTWAGVDSEGLKGFDLLRHRLPGRHSG